MSQDRTSWPIGQLRRHPQADLVPSMDADEVDVLRDSIARHGIEHPLDILDDGTILDGHHRFSAARLEGLAEVPVRVVTPADPVDYMIRAALERRHLSGAQKRELAMRLLKAQPDQSDRRVAKTVRVAPTTVGKVRKQLEEKGDVSRMDTREDSKGRKQPVAERKEQEPISLIAQWEAAVERLTAVNADLNRIGTQLANEQPGYRPSMAAAFRKAARSLNGSASKLDPPKRRPQAAAGFSFELVHGERPPAAS